MFKNYLKLGVRNFLRFKFYSIINLIGMSLGLFIGILVLIYVLDELSFDKFHLNNNRIYKVVTSAVDGGGIETNAWPIARKLETEFPEIEIATYSKKMPSSMLLNYEGKRYEHNLHYADNNFMEIFSFNFIEGDKSTALDAPYSIVVSKDLKEKYFDSGLVLGRTITLRDSLEFTITGVIDNVPSQSHIQFDALTSFSTYTTLNRSFSYSEGWGNFNVRNYVLLRDDSDLDLIQAKTANLYRDNVGEWLEDLGVDFSVELIPLSKIYLESSLGNGFGPSGSLERLKLVSLIGLFIIALACINFVNISTARSTYRAKEVGIRKLSGSSNSRLFWQFIFEAFVLMSGAFIFSLLLIELALPFFNSLLGKSYRFAALFNLQVGVSILFLILFITFLSAFYPGMILSRMAASKAIKGKIQNSKHGIILRRILVVSQLSISATLVIGTFIILNQLNFMRNQDLGFAKDQILVIDGTNLPKNIKVSVLKNELKSISVIQSVSLANALPGKPGWQGQWAYDGSMESDKHVDTEYMAIDEDYIETLELKLIAGKNFNSNSPADLQSGLVINESTVKAFGWSSAAEAIGKEIVSPSQRPQGIVIGVVKDYHGLGLQNNIWPKVMDYASETYGRYYAIKSASGGTSVLVAQVKSAWNKIYPDDEFNFFFLDQEFDKQYKAEERLMSVFVLFATIGIIIAMIGLLGMVTFILANKMNEICVRKVHGASIASLSILLSKEFIALVLIANLLVLGPAWYLGNEWLNHFAYHTIIHPSIFVLNLIITLSIALFTIAFQVIRAARVNPAKLLRTE